MNAYENAWTAKKGCDSLAGLADYYGFLLLL